MSVTFRSGSESYEQLTPDGDLGDTGLNEQFADNRATPSDDSDIYSQVDFYREERERELLKSGDITNKLAGWFLIDKIIRLKFSMRDVILFFIVSVQDG